MKFPLTAEWLEADGLGGFASGTVGGGRTRRYHAWLLAALADGRRLVLVNGADYVLSSNTLGARCQPSHRLCGPPTARSQRRLRWANSWA